MRSDIELALGILMEYQRRGKPLRLIENFQINEETGEVKVLMPEWQDQPHLGIPFLVR